MRTRTLFAVGVLGLVAGLGLAAVTDEADPPVVDTTDAVRVVTVGPGNIPAVEAAVASVGEVLAAERLGVEAAVAIENERLAIEAAVWIAQHPPRPPAPRAPAPARTPANYDPGDGSVWDRLAQCESGGNWSYDGPSGYDGGLQFLPSTWLSNGGGQYAPYAWGATREQQIDIAERLRAARGFAPWPACARRLGLL